MNQNEDDKFECSSGFKTGGHAPSNPPHVSIGFRFEIREEFQNRKRVLSMMLGKNLSNSQMLEILMKCSETMYEKDPDFLKKIEIEQPPRGRPKRPHVAYGDKKYLKPEDFDPAPPNDRDQAQNSPDRSEPDDAR